MRRVLTKDADALRGDLAGALARVNRATWERNIDEGQVGRQQRPRPETGLGTFGRRFKVAEVTKVWNSELAKLAIEFGFIKHSSTTPWLWKPFVDLALQWGMISGPQAPAMSPAVHAALIKAMDEDPKKFAALLHESTKHVPSVSDLDDLDELY